VIQLQPEESIQLQVLAKEPGSGMHMLPVNLNLDLQQAFTERRAEAYERLLIDVIRGRLTHFMRRDELEAAWAWAEPILDGWQQVGRAATRLYGGHVWPGGVDGADGAGQCRVGGRVAVSGLNVRRDGAGRCPTTTCA
jgi:glucose-6-phosphate 1-dehydrogenase